MHNNVHNANNVNNVNNDNNNDTTTGKQYNDYEIMQWEDDGCSNIKHNYSNISTSITMAIVRIEMSIK